ncbi:XkdW family protein [Cytobacillus purgationiresistens]|uniref:Bacteriophage SP-beta YorD domain-containing protein n=1 Tax=Cytobacillus purgationiresistens TaxID=863449 RepID=A0ABU0AF93_9BACI|nr:XkdW family protein [Cytobacillus purgationiresistens]MDQ0269924.1 hypothetical protein [Cytobacillus purgationiresistens]
MTVSSNMNFDAAIRRLYPDAVPNVDYVITADVEGRQSIAHWDYNDVPLPTLEDIQTAWEEVLDNPPKDPLTPAEELLAVKLQLASVLKINAEKEIELQKLKEQNAFLIVNGAQKEIELQSIKEQNASILLILAQNNLV